MATCFGEGNSDLPFLLPCCRLLPPIHSYLPLLANTSERNQC
jgi:hypothetical protein